MQQRTIGRYRVLEEIASGGQGTVYRAWETTTGRVVALKVLHPHLSSDAGVLERFRREAQLAAAVTHPNITQIFEVGRDGDYHFISMEYLPLSIQNLIESQGALPIDRAADICYQTARALEAASGRGIIHRDIKPQNLLLSPDGVVKVTDFGIARATSLSTMTRTGAVMGTPHYMSPEQARGQRVDTRSDLYSLGIVLYQMLTGRIPFEAETPWEVIRQHIEVKAEPVRRVRSEVPRPLERLVERCLEKRPDRRYQSAGELASALREAVPGTGGGRRQQSPVTPAPAQRPATSPAARAASTPSRAAQPERIRPSETWMSSWARAWQRTHRSRWAWIVTALSLVAALVAISVNLDIADRVTNSLNQENPTQAALTPATVVPAPTTPPESTAVPIGLQPLVQISNDFVGDLKPGWLLHGSAKHDPAGTVVLTEPVNDQTGALFYTGQVRVERFEAVFKFEIGEGSGADGLQFVIRQVHPTVGGPGLNEFEIDFDTFMNDHDPSDNNVGFVEPGKRKITASSLGAGYSLRNSGVFEATVAFDNGNVEVYLNNPTIGLRPELIIEHTIPNFVPFDGYFGFKAWTSGSNDRHVLHEVSFTQLDVEQAAVSYEFPTEPLRGDRVFLNSGSLNGQQITSSNPFLSVTPGQAISGTVNLMVANDHGGHAIFPVEATPTWGDHQSGYWDVPISVPSYGTARRDVTIDLTAPSTPGVYAIIFAAQAEFTGGYITSATHWPSGSPQWNNDDDIAGWSASQIDFAIANGYLRAHQHGSGVDFAHFGAAAVKIIVP